MTIGCNIWMICLILIWFFYGLSRMFHLPQFVWALRSSVSDVFINFLLIDATDRSKISSDQKRFFIALAYTPFHFSRTLPLKMLWIGKTCSRKHMAGTPSPLAPSTLCSSSLTSSPFTPSSTSTLCSSWYWNL